MPSCSATGRHFGGADRLGDAVRDAGQESDLHRQPDLRLVVLINMALRVVELRAAHVGVAIHEHPVPRHFDVVEIHQRVVLVEARRDRIVVDRHRMRFVGFARQHAQALGVHRHRAGKRQILFARFERLQIGDEHLVRHDRRRAEHLGAANGDAGRIFVDHRARPDPRLLAPVLAALGLRIDDDVGQEQVVLAGVIEIVGEGLGALGAVLAKHVEAMRCPTRATKPNGPASGRESRRTAPPRLAGLCAAAPSRHSCAASARRG
jgi:hypothetical protein